jgi:murein DD-endopeptidase MepM/ murein hydrolase activator NlpD
MAGRPVSTWKLAVGVVVVVALWLAWQAFHDRRGRSGQPPAEPKEAASPPARPGESLVLPTANRALFEPGGEERYFVGTVGRPWTSGTFGCVRSEGWQFHEGLDIRCVERDRQGEPADAVRAVAAGQVVYRNLRAALSSYGIYVVVRHQLHGWEVYSLYAHLAEVGAGLAEGQTVQAGDVLGRMGRTANTSEGISRERAHLHFELNLLVNDRFAAWHQRNYPNQRNDHGLWNGRNFLGIDPRLLLLHAESRSNRFQLSSVIGEQAVLCRVLVRATDFPWLRRYPQLVETIRWASGEPVAGYEIHLNYSGLPVRLIPRPAAEVRGRNRFQLLEVNEAEQRTRPCGRLVRRRDGRWELAPAGERLLDLLTF